MEEQSLVRNKKTVLEIHRRYSNSEADSITDCMKRFEPI